MRDLTFLHGQLEASESPGLDSLDPIFSRITDLAEQDDFVQAADEVHKLIDARVYDIRLIAYYFFQVFREEGLAGAATILGGVESLLDRNFKAFGPARNREKYVEKSLTWLFNRMADAIEYHRKKDDATHRAWRDAVDPVAMDAGLEAGRALMTRLVPPVYPLAGEALGRVVREMRAARETALSERPEALAPEKPGDAPAQVLPIPVRPRLREIQLSNEGETVEIQVSVQFVELCKKLRAFEKLVEKRNFEKAALVGDDLMTMIESFDPRKYFPELFADFSALLSTNVAAIAPHWERRASLEWKTMQQFYQVDLKKFVGE